MKQYNHRRGMTLIELLIAIVLLSVVILALSSIDLFSRNHLISSDRRARLQNEVSYALEHMTQQISRAVGNMNIVQQKPANNDNITGNKAIGINTDSNADGQADLWIAYRFRNNSTAEDSQIWYCPNCTNSTCSKCNTGWGNSTNIIARRIYDFIPSNVTDNYLNVTITGRWEPAQAESVDNPQVNMSASIKMPSVSTH